MYTWSCLSKLSLEEKRELLTGEMIKICFEDDRGKVYTANKVPLKMIRRFSKRAVRETVVESSSKRERGAPQQILILGTVPLQRFDITLDRLLSTFRTACNMEADMAMKPFEGNIPLTLQIYLALSLLEVPYHTAIFHSYLRNYICKNPLRTTQVEMIWCSMSPDTQLVKRLLENVARTFQDSETNNTYKRRIKRLEAKYPNFQKILAPFMWREQVYQELHKQQSEDYYEDLLKNGKNRSYPRYLLWDQYLEGVYIILASDQDKAWLDKGWLSRL